MRARSKAKRSQWNIKSVTQTRKNRYLQAQLYRSRHRESKLEAQLQQLRQLTQPQHIAGHVYPAQMVATAVFIVVFASGSLRCAAKTSGFVSQLMGWDYGEPSHVNDPQLGATLRSLST